MLSLLVGAVAKYVGYNGPIVSGYGGHDDAGWWPVRPSVAPAPHVVVVESVGSVSPADQIG